MDAKRAEALFGDFFRDLSVAGRALSAYPQGHPAVAEGLARAHATLSALLLEAGPVELAAARDALLWSDRRFTSPVAAQLATILRRRRAAGLLLDPGASAEELETFLRALAVNTRSVRDAGSFAAELAAAGLVRIRVSDLDFSSLALVEGDGDDEPTAPEAGSFASRVVRRLLGGGGRGGSGGVGGPSAFAAALQAIAENFRQSTDAERAAGIAAIAAVAGRLGAGDRARLAKALASVLPPPAAAALDQALGEPGPGGRGRAGAPGAATAGIERRPLAPVRLAFATDDIDSLREVQAPAGVLAALLDLPGDREAPVLSPAAARVGLALRSSGVERDPTERMLGLAEHADVAPEALPPVLKRFEAGYLRLLAEGRIGEAAALLDRVQRRSAAQGPAAPGFRATAERITGSDAVEALVSSLPDLPEEALGAAPALIAGMGPATARHLLDVLARTENRRMRFRLLDLLAKLGPVVARDAASLLSDPRWYVVRNMLLLLRRVGDARSIPAVRRCVDHPDLRVRLEAIHNLFAFDRDVPRELLRRALQDPDPRQAEAAMELAGKYGIAEAVEPIVACLCAWDPFGRRRSVRLKAIRALAAIGNPRALAGLGRFRARFQLLPPAIEERRELYRTLPAYPEEAYQGWVESGLRSRDPEIRRLSAAMGPRPEAAP